MGLFVCLLYYFYSFVLFFVIVCTFVGLACVVLFFHARKNVMVALCLVCVFRFFLLFLFIIFLLFLYTRILDVGINFLILYATHLYFYSFFFCFRFSIIYFFPSSVWDVLDSFIFQCNYSFVLVFLVFFCFPSLYRYFLYFSKVQNCVGYYFYYVGLFFIYFSYLFIFTFL